MKRCSFCAWIPILPWPVWPLASQCSLGQNAVVGSMTLLLAVRGNIATRSMSGPPFPLQLHRTTVCCRATIIPIYRIMEEYITLLQTSPFTGWKHGLKTNHPKMILTHGDD